MKDSHLYSGFRLSKDGHTIIFNSSESDHPGDIYAADADMKNIRRLTDVNPQLKEKRLSKTQLIEYLDADGNKTYGVLYYPSDYEAGKKYPTVFNIYEQFFDDTRELRDGEHRQGRGAKLKFNSQGRGSVVKNS